jgi:hypothetical protein
MPRSYLEGNCGNPAPAFWRRYSNIHSFLCLLLDGKEPNRKLREIVNEKLYGLVIENNMQEMKVKRWRQKAMTQQTGHHKGQGWYMTIEPRSNRLN